jgi:hypothetical protein
VVAAGYFFSSEGQNEERQCTTCGGGLLAVVVCTHSLGWPEGGATNLESMVGGGVPKRSGRTAQAECVLGSQDTFP